VSYSHNILVSVLVCEVNTGMLVCMHLLLCIHDCVWVFWPVDTMCMYVYRGWVLPLGEGTALGGVAWGRGGGVCSR